MGLDRSNSHTPLLIEAGENPSPYMRGVPVPEELRLDRGLGTLTDPQKALWSYQNIQKITPIDVIFRGTSPPRTLPYGSCVLDAKLDVDGTSSTLLKHLQRLNVTGFLAIQKGAVIAEVYRNGFAPSGRHALFSVTKSLVGLLTGILMEEGVLDAQQPVVDYLPELASSGFAKASLRQVLDMTTSVAWNHERSDTLASVNINSIAGGFTTGPDVSFTNTLEFISSLGEDGAHGNTYTYNPTNTEILGWIISRISGRSWQSVFSDRVWSLLGAERDAFVTVDSGGHGFATAGVLATLRDLGRLGWALTESDPKIAPARFIEDICTQEPGSLNAMHQSKEAGALGETSYYKNQFRVIDGERGIFLAAGFGGQMIYVDRSASLAGVFLASRPDLSAIKATQARLMQTLAEDLCA